MQSVRDVRSATLPLVLLLAACAVGADEGEAIGTAAQPIVKGTPSTAADDATVFLLTATSSCTGTLLAPDLVLTARHCVSRLDDQSVCGTILANDPPSSVRVSVGRTASGQGIAAQGKRLFVPPGRKDVCGADLALVQLDRAIAGAKTAPLRFAPVRVGEATTAVGYGDDGSGRPTDGRFRRTGVRVLAVGPGDAAYTTAAGRTIAYDVPDGDFATGESTCFGDSGGPLFDAQGRLVGVTSRGVDDDCLDRPSLFTSVAAHEAWFRAVAESTGARLGEPPARPSSRDPTDEGDPGDEGDGAPATSRAPARAAFRPAQSSGCAAAPAAPPSRSPLAAAALAFALALAARRRAPTRR